jgi:O-succinylbenzoate synthase
MNIAYALYELESNRSLSAKSSTQKRQGALLKVTFEAGMVGFSDCHPWPELGDLPLRQQLERLARGQKTPLLHCALEFAKIDAAARFKKMKVLVDLNIPRSHFLVTYLLDWTPRHVSQVIQQGYTHVKIKVGRNMDQEIECLHSLFLNSSIKLRLDFNEHLTSESFRSFLSRMEKMHSKVEFIEDPFPYHPQSWAAFQKEGWNLACDREAHRACHHPESAGVLIVKPALQSIDEWQQWIYQTRIVTSYLGHPLGQMTAAYVASLVDPGCCFVHGLHSHYVYHHNPFSRHLNWENPDFIVPPGQGFGFDQELEQLNWIPVK